MKKVAILLLLACIAHGQALKVIPNGNIGIGTSSPSIWFNPTPLVHFRGIRPTLYIQPSAANGLGTLVFAGVSTNSMFHLNFQDGAAARLSINSYQLNAGAEVFAILGNGNIGIGLPNPTARFHVSGGGIKLDGANQFEFGAGVAKEWNAGKIAYQLWTDGLDIVGAGPSLATRKIIFHTEGGANFYAGFGGVNFYSNVYAMNYYPLSDVRIKKDIKNTQNALAKILSLRSVDYNLIDSIEVEKESLVNKNEVSENKTENASITNNTTDVNTTTGTAVNKDKWEYVKQKRKIRVNTEPTKINHGFIAQEVEKVMPEIVSTNTDGLKGVNYIAIIPILVEALKEQNAKIEELESKLKSANDKKTARADELKNTSTTGAYLFQNSPNPFNTETQIKYQVPEATKDAAIYVYDLNGKQLKAFTNITKGESFVTLKAAELTAGMYLYSLVTDGTIIDTKRMIIVD